MTGKKKKTVAKTSKTDERRLDMIREAAYYISEKECFSGDPYSDWIQAEKQIEVQLQEK